MNNLLSLYDNSVSFICIYISEAHANDEWPIRNKKDLKIKQHKSLNERINISKELKTKKYNLKWNLYCDNINNDFQNIYSAWPLRVYLINNKNKSINWILEAEENPSGWFNLLKIGKKLQKLKN